jgi:transposase
VGPALDRPDRNTCSGAGVSELRGVPQQVLFDQMKTVIVEYHRGTHGRLQEHPECARLAAHWGFRIRAWRPYRAKDQRQRGAPRGLRSDHFV